MGLVAELLDLVLPRTCPGCGTPGAWCRKCAASLARRPRPVRITVPVPPCYALTRYRGPARAAVIAAKERGGRDLPPILGSQLGAGLLRLHRISVIPHQVWLVPAPSRPAAARARGGDPVLRMCRAAAAELARAGVGAGVAPCLFTGRGAQDSVGLDAGQRRANLNGRVRWAARGAPPPEVPVVLVDDVLTTGATAEIATRVLDTYGHHVAAVVVVTAVPALG